MSQIFRLPWAVVMNLSMMDSRLAKVEPKEAVRFLSLQNGIRSGVVEKKRGHPHPQSSC